MCEFEQKDQVEQGRGVLTSKELEEGRGTERERENPSPSNMPYLATGQGGSMRNIAQIRYHY
jgi:hypothetical protein